MELPFFVRGLIIGFSIAAPVGPIGVLCIHRTLSGGRRAGFVSGLGAATADGLYGCVAAFGLTVISNLLIQQQLWLRLLGGLFLCVLGLKTLLTPPSSRAADAQGVGLAGAYLSTLFLTLTNPLTILSFAAIFAGFGLGGTQGDYPGAAVLVLGVFLGSTFWWLLLSGAVSLLGRKFQPSGLVWVNRISGGMITLFGVLALLFLL